MLIFNDWGILSGSSQPVTNIVAKTEKMKYPTIRGNLLICSRNKFKDKNLNIFFFRTYIFIFTALLFFITVTSGTNAKNLPLVRDSEVETTLWSYATPIFKVAGLKANTVKIRIVNHSHINAFVSNGLNLFLNIGLLTTGVDPGPVMAVIAHEAGHLSAGHLIRTRKAISDASSKALLGSILSVTALLAGGGNAAAATNSAGTAIAHTSLLRYSTAQEEAADQAAVKYLNSLGIPLDGMLYVLNKLKQKELFTQERPASHLGSHPLTQERIRFVRNQVDKSRNASNAFTLEQIKTFERMKNKLYAFTHRPKQTLTKFPEDNQKIAARYARAIAYYRIPHLERAIAEIDSLLEEYPNDPWFYELKGQMLFENGRVSLAILPFTKAVSLRPKDALFRLSLARTQLENNSPLDIQDAINNLRIATQLEPNYSPHWYFLGIGYGRNKEFTKSNLALAEASFLQRNYKDAIYLAEKVKRGSIIGSPQHLRAEDIFNSASNRLNR